MMSRPFSEAQTNIFFVRGDATAVSGRRAPKVIAHCCNDAGRWGKGFVLAISRRWPHVAREYFEWHRDRAKNDFELGACQFVEAEPGIVVANMIGQNGVKTGPKGVPIRYSALARALDSAMQHAAEKGASVHMPRVGCGLAGGVWSTVEPIVVDCAEKHGVVVFVYDLA